MIRPVGQSVAINDLRMRQFGLNRCCIVDRLQRLHIAITSGATLTYCANGINRVIRSVTGARGGDSIVVDTNMTTMSPPPHPLDHAHVEHRQIGHDIGHYSQ